ncbi:MAG: iron ABC transporter permease [Oscillospiraceae bacterium]|nr:iron ABC transporter permease [Oscillospiraceae bacterium]MCL2227478.1 iron ABC transporter permease [Oscillospiraceae bacterium]
MKYLQTMNRKKLVVGLIYLGLLWFLLVMLVIPNINTVLFVFWQDGQFTLRAFERVLNSTRAMNALRNSFVLAPALSITVGFIGVSLVLITEYFAVKGSKILRLGYMTTLVYGGIILVSGYRFLYGRGGYLTNIFAAINPYFNVNWFEGFWAVLFVMTFATTGNHIIFLRNAMSAVDYQTVEAAKNMGAKQFTILRRIVLPVLIPPLLAVTIFTFMTALTATSAPLLVGGLNFQTINPMILQFSRMAGSRDLAALMAVFLGVATLILVALLSRLEKRGHYLSASKVKTSIVKQKIHNPVVNVLVHVYAYFMFVVYVAPVVLIILFSFTNSATIGRGQLSFSAFTFENYVNVFSRVSSYRPILVSVGFSLAASIAVAVVVIVVCRMITKHKNRLSTVIEYGFMIPWLLPAVLVALGLITTFNQPRWFMMNRVLTGTMIIMVIGYMIIRIPFTLRITRAAFFALDDALEDAARNLGAKSLYTFFRVILPIILPSVLAIFALNFSQLMQDFDMSVFLYHPLNMPLAVQIQTLTEEAAADNTAITFVYAVLMMVVSTVVLYLVYGRGSKVRE